MASSAYKGDWRSAKDPKSGKIYYYNIKTRETTWKMPIEMTSLKEQESALMKAQQNKSFFEEMERNMLRKMRGEPISPAYDPDSKESYRNNPPQEKHGPPFPMKREVSSEFNRNTSNNDLNGSTNRRYRTISSIDDEIIDLMKYNSLEDSNDTVGTRSRSNTLVSNGQRRGSKLSLHEVSYPTALSPVVGVLQDIADAKYEIEQMKSNSIRQKERKRRNSTGTIYVETTMSFQDNNGMIHVVCFVIRTHLLSAEKENKAPVYAPEYDVFNDSYTPSQRVSDGSKNTRPFNAPVNSRTSPSSNFSDDCKSTDSFTRRSKCPSLTEIKDFFNLIYNKSQLESECIIMTLIYLERLIIKTKGKLVLKPNNWKAILFACIVMASKVWDDLSMWNIDFSHVSDHLYDLKRVNELELTMLDAFNYEVKVSASDYAKYYFQLRSLIARLKFSKTGLYPDSGDVLMDVEAIPGSFELLPLDIAGARKLQLATEKYESKQTSEESNQKRRNTVDYSYESKSTGNESVPVPISIRRFKSDAMDSSGHHHLLSEHQQHHHTIPVLLEQLMHSQHNDADGVAHTSSKHNTPIGNKSAVRDFRLDASNHGSNLCDVVNRISE